MTFVRTIKSAAIAVLLASAVDLLLLFAARALGASMIVPHGPEHIKQLLGVSDVVIANALLVTLGALVFFGLSKITRRPKKWFTIVAIVGFVLLLFPLFQDIDGPTRFVLFLMHIVSAVALFWALGQRAGVAAKTAVVALALVAVPTPARADGPGDLVFEVTGLKDASGQVLVTVWNDEDKWLEADQAFRSAAVPIQGGKARVVFKGIPAGAYAACAVHDANKSGALDTKFPKRPAEGIGCSRGAKGGFGPPKWKNAQFEHRAAAETLGIAIEYP